MPTFVHVVIDADNPPDPHSNTVGDIDGDGLVDAIASSSTGGGMFWYEYPDWTKHTIQAAGSWSTDMQVADVDGDGDLDIVAPLLDDLGLNWYENPRPTGNPRTDPWAEHLISAAPGEHHDVEVGDVDGDGDTDVVTRLSQSGDTFFWQQIDPFTWNPITVNTDGGKGTSLGDLDDDGDIDILQNGFWMEQVSPTSWTRHEIDSGWPIQLAVLIADIDGDGANDVVMAPGDANSVEPFSWYSANDPVNGPWTEHVVDPAVEYFHTFKTADVDLDGDLDLVTAEMHQSTNPDEVGVYYNEGAGLSWNKVVIATTGSHNLRVADFGNDGDVDIFGANWTDNAPNTADIEMWENQLDPAFTLDQWERHIIEPTLPWQVLFVDGADLNGDGLRDLLTGGWWYPNPGSLDGNWVQTPIAGPIDNMAAVDDIDNDGDFDVFGVSGKPAGDDFSWARNDGAGNFTSFEITPDGGGEFLQGVRVDQVTSGGNNEIVLSWQHGGPGTQMFRVPTDPTDPGWALDVISLTTNGEQIATGDFDDDGLVDVHLGESWLKQLGNGTFETRPVFTLGGGALPDRVEAADMDGDGDLDVVIGASHDPLLVWGENEGNGAAWTQHVIAADFKYHSVDVADIDRDGDIDIVGGAHQANGEVFVFENTGQAQGWTTHVVDPGDADIDHHDGTRLVDMDGDGDLDIISIGWEVTSLVIYENLATTGGGPSDAVPPTIQSVTTTPGDPNQVVVGFNEPLDPTTAEEAANYAVSDGITVSNAALGGGGSQVTLTTSTLTEDFTYTLTVDNVEDLAGNAIAPATEATFVYTAPPVDVDPPTIQSVTTTPGNPNQVVIGFNEPLDPTTAEDAANYAVSDGITVSNAALGGGGSQVTLTTSTLTEDFTYTLTVDNVEDLAGNAIAPATEATFVYTAPPAGGIVGYWPFGEGSGTSTADLSGNGHTGTLVNGPVWNNGAIQFDGVDDYIDVGNIDVAGNAITIAAWFNSTNLANCSSQDCRIVSKAFPGISEQDHYFMVSTISFRGDARLRFRLKTGTATSTLKATSGDLTNNQWFHVAAVYDGATMRLYLDGAEVGSTAKTGTIATDPSIPVWIGGNPSGATDRPWAGHIDDVRIYDRALTPQEIQGLANDQP